MQSIDDLADPKSYLCVTDPQNIEWYNLVLHPTWVEPQLLGIEKSEYPHKELLYNFRCYLIPKKDLIKIKNNSNYNKKLLSSLDTYRDRYEIFSREYYWSPGYKYFNQPYYSGNFIKDILVDEKSKVSIRVIIPVENYYWEEGFDCSKEDILSYYVPSTYLFNKMQLKYSVKDGVFENQEGDIICFDPSIYNKSLQCMLLRKTEFLEVLKQNELTAIWSFWGEKRINSGYSEIKNFDRMEMGGLYYLENNAINGSYNTRFVKFDNL